MKFWLARGILVLAATLLFANQALTQQVAATGPTLPIVQVHHVEGDPSQGFRTSCLVLFSDGEYHRERRVQVASSGHARPSWKAPAVAEGSISSKEVNDLLAQVDDPSFSSIPGVIGGFVDLWGKIAFYQDGSVVPHDNIDFFTVSIASAKGGQSFETSPEAGHREPLRPFFEWFKSIEKRQATGLPSSQANGCVQLVGKAGLPTQKPALTGFQFPTIRGKPSFSSEPVSPGAVKLSFVVNPDGTTGDIKVGKGATVEVARVATDAARKWAFYPARLLGVPVAFEMQAEMTFSNAPTVNISPAGHFGAPLLQ